MKRVYGVVSVFFPLLTVGGPLSAQISYTVFPATLSQLSPSGRQPADRNARVTIDVRDSTIEFLVKALVHQSQLKLAYDYREPALSQRRTVHVVNVDVMSALATVLAGTGLQAQFASDGETVVLRPRKGGVPAEHGRLFASGIIIGRVTDSASGAGLGGASVRVEGTKLSAVTSDSGRFTLRDIPAGEQVLTVKLFGYRPAERTVMVVDSQSTTVRVSLAAIPTVLSGVVTTATGQQRKIEVGNDITTLNADSIRQVAPISSVTDLLEGRVPGLTVLHTSGAPGDPSRLRLRGAGSIQLDNDPIIIIDGIRIYSNQSDRRNDNLAPVKDPTHFGGQTTANDSIARGIGAFAAPSPLDQIDPTSIETIQVLKGPSATAVYGSDAAAGVVVITTKHGRAGPTTWALNLGAGVNWLPGGWPTYDYRFGVDTVHNLQYFNQAGATQLCPWYVSGCAVDSVVPFQALNDPRYTVLGHGNDQTASLTVSGGVPALTYSLTGTGAGTLGYLHLPAREQQRYDSVYGRAIPHALVRPDNYSTWGVTGSMVAAPSTTLRVTLQSSLFTGNQQKSSLQDAIVQLGGEYVAANDTGPLLHNEFEQVTDNQVTSTNGATVAWQARPWLPLTLTGGLSSIQRTDVAYVPFGVNAYGATTELENGSDTTGYYGLGHGSSRDVTGNLGTVIPLRLAHLALGGNVHLLSTANDEVASNLLAPGVSTPTTFFRLVNVPSQYTMQATAQSTYGWYVEPQLSFAQRFYVTPGFRLDGGSGGTHASYTNGGGTSGGLAAFPKIDLSYVAVDRQGQRPLWGMVTLFRPRLALGVAGIQPLPQDRLRLFNINSQNGYQNYNQNGSGAQVLNPVGGVQQCPAEATLDGGQTLVPAVCLNYLGNTQLHPERDREVEGGFDATLWGRLSVTATQYTKTAQDAIIPLPVATSVFAGSVETNVGEIRNTGTELTLDATVLERRALSWHVGATLSRNTSLVVHLNPGMQPLCYGTSDGLAQNNHACNGTMLRPGYPLNGEWAQPIASYADANHDGVIEPNEIRLADSSVYVGVPGVPKVEMAFTNDLTILHGTLGFHMSVDVQRGITQNNIGACTSAAFLNLPNDPATPLSTQAAVVAANCGPTGNGVDANNVTDFGLIQTVNTVRIQSLSINYVVPRAVAQCFRASRMTVALQGANLGLLTNYRGKDPNVNAFSTVSAGDEAADLGQLPEPRTWRLSLQLGN